MKNKNVVLEIGDFLGFCDLNGIEAIQTEQVQQLEEYITACNEARNDGEDLVPDAIWDRLMEILRQVNPESELCKYTWEDSVDELDDTDVLVKNNPMFSIQTIKSYDCMELKEFVKRLPDDITFDMHFSVKLNGHGIRLKYKNGEFFNARSRARSSAGRDITEALRVTLYDLGVDVIDDLASFDLCEVRGEWVLPFENLDQARSYNPNIKSAFSAVSSMGRASASEDEWRLLRFVAYEFIAEDMHFQSKSEEYSFLEDLGFETPMSWVIEGLSKDSFIEDLKGIVDDCEAEVRPDADGTGGYDYYTDGIVGAINSTELFRTLGDDGSHYKFGNIALKVGYWEQNILSGYVQCILWTKGKSKLSPVAIIGDDANMIEYSDKHEIENDYVFNKNEIANWDDLGVISQVGNKVRRIPLYEPANIVALDAYPGYIVHFRYGGEAGVVPCFEDGTPLVDGRIQSMLSGDEYLSEFDIYMED
jgi:NAD-dependent DNA ligase